MKKIVLILISFTIFSCKNEVQKTENSISAVASLEKGQQLFQENNCAACHQTNQKVVGPSLKQIAKIYKEQNASLKNFLKAESKPIIDPLQYETMKINLETTKGMTDEELNSLEIYIYSFSK
jgi:cytochrome c